MEYKSNEELKRLFDSESSELKDRRNISKLKSRLKKGYGYKPIITTYTDDGSKSEDFFRLNNLIHSHIKSNELFSRYVENGVIGNVVAKNGRNKTLTVHPFIRLDINVNHIGIVPHGKGLKISRLYIKPEHQGKGMGTMLMDIFLTMLIEIGSDFNIVLETTGFVGMGENELHTPISEQTRFFRKFGFRVVQSKSRGGYRFMKLVDFSYINNLKKKLEIEQSEVFRNIIEDVEYKMVA